MDAYKVVTRNRYSLIIARNNPFSLKYPKDEIVESIKGTVGIMCFKTKHYAYEFMSQMYLQLNPIIIKVALIGEITYPEHISRWLSTGDIKAFYKTKHHTDIYYTVSPPKGTVCCSKVKVLT